MGFDAYEQLAVDPGAVGDVARSILETPSQPGESYADTQYRSAQQAGATARIQAIKGKQWAARGVPSYQDMQGNTKPVVDDTGSPLSKLDPKHNIAYDSTGSPKKIDFDVAGGSPVLKDPFEGLETTTDPKTGHQYQIAPGLPWRWVGTDAQTAQKAEFARQDADLSKASAALGRKLTLTEYDEKFHSDAIKDVRSQLKQLSVADTDPVTGDPLDYDGLVAGINSQFDDLKKNDTTANAKEYFGMGGYTPEALKAQADLDLQRTAALRAAAKGHAHAQALGGIRQQAEAVRAQRMMIEQTKLDHETEILKAQGIDISQPKQQYGDTPEDSAQNEQIAQASGVHPATAQAYKQAVAGQKPYAIEDGKPKPVDGKYEEGLTAAAQDGLIAPPAPEVLQAARTADAKYQELMKQAGGNQKLKAFIASGVKSYTALQAGMAASALVAPFDPELAAGGAALGGVGAAVVPMLAHGIAFLAGMFGANKALDKLSEKAAEYSDDMASIQAAIKLQPGAAQLGNFAGMGPAAIKSVMNLSKAAGVAAAEATGAGASGAKAAAGYLGKTAGTGAVGGAIFETTIRPGFDWMVDQIGGALGREKEGVQAPTVGSVLEMAGIGAILSGLHLTIKDIGTAEATDIVKRGMQAMRDGKPLDEVLSPSENDAFMSIGEKLAKMKASGEDLIKDPEKFSINVRQVLTGEDRPAGDYAKVARDAEIRRTPRQKEIRDKDTFEFQKDGQTDWEAIGNKHGITAAEAQAEYARATQIAGPVQARTTKIEGVDPMKAGLPEPEAQPPASATAKPVTPNPKPAEPGTTNIGEKLGSELDKVEVSPTSDLERDPAKRAQMSHEEHSQDHALRGQRVVEADRELEMVKELGGTKEQIAAAEKKLRDARDDYDASVGQFDYGASARLAVAKGEPLNADTADRYGFAKPEGYSEAKAADGTRMYVKDGKPAASAPASVAKASPEIPIDIDQRIALVMEDFTQRLADADRKIAMAKGQGNSDVIAEAKAEKDAIFEDMKQRLGTDIPEQVPQIVRDRLEGGAHEWEDGKGLREKSQTITTDDVERVRQLFAEHGKESVSLIQRKMRLGYTKAFALFEAFQKSKQPPAPNEPKLPASERNDQSQPEGAKPAGGASEVAKTEEGKPGGEPAGQAGGKPDAEAVERRKKLVGTVNTEMRLRHKELKNLGHSPNVHEGKTPPANKSGIALIGNEITVDVEKLDNVLQRISDPKEREDYVRAAIASEEVLHLGFKKVTEDPEMRKRALAIPGNEPEAVKLARELYRDFDTLTPIEQSAEVVRVLMQALEAKEGDPNFEDQQKLKKSITETTWKFIQDLIDRVKKMLGAMTDSTREFIDLIEARMKGAETEKAKAEKPKPKGTEPIRPGKVGDMLADGQVVTTATGRNTTPFPRLGFETDRKTQATVKRVDAWLHENAIAEAEARGDDFNGQIFRSENPKNMPPASKDSMEEYLFGDNQPPVIKSPLKPLVEKPKAEEKPQPPLPNRDSVLPEKKADAPKLSDAAQDIKDALGDLFSAAAPDQQYDRPIPREKREVLNGLVAKLIDTRGVDTPEKLAGALAELGPKAQAFSQNIWFKILSELEKSPERPPEPKWGDIYAGLAAKNGDDSTTQADFKSGDAVTADEGTGTIAFVRDDSVKINLPGGKLSMWIPKGRVKAADSSEPKDIVPAKSIDQQVEDKMIDREKREFPEIPEAFWELFRNTIRADLIPDMSDAGKKLILGNDRIRTDTASTSAFHDLAALYSDMINAWDPEKKQFKTYRGGEVTNELSIDYTDGNAAQITLNGGLGEKVQPFGNGWSSSHGNYITVDAGELKNDNTLAALFTHLKYMHEFLMSQDSEQGDDSEADEPKADAAPQNREELTAEVRRILSSGGTLDRRALTKLAAESGLSQKDVDEAAEHGLVMASRDRIEKGGTPKEIFDDLVDLYGRQPNLTAKTATSKVNQAYSTPIPLAYATGQAIDLAGAENGYEPTAGNAALTIAGKAENITVNEIDPSRLQSLRAQGFKAVTSNDATVARGPVNTDRATMNAPFGSQIEGGEKKEFLLYKADSGQNVMTPNIDQAISLRALEALTTDGKASIIVGGKKGTDAERQAGYRVFKTQLPFWNYLYANYNVTDHFTVAGELYDKQGAGWPVDVIIVAGKGKSKLTLPYMQAPPILSSWEDVGKRLLHEDNTASTESNPKPAAKPAGGTGGSRGGSSVVTAGGTEAGGSGGVGGKPTVPATSAKLPAGQEPASDGGKTIGLPAGSAPAGAGGKPLGEDSQGKLSAGGSAEDGVQRADTDGLDKLEPNEVLDSEFATQASYTPRSKSPLINACLTPVNLRDQIYHALDKLEAEVGNIDDFVARELAWLKGGKEELFSVLDGGQVDAVALGIYQIMNGSALIIGDQTGMGKGRAAAAIMTWAQSKGYTPIFMTAGDNLFLPMIEDLKDIHAPHMIPFITNAGCVLKNENEEEVFRNESGERQKRKIREVTASGKLPGNANVIFTTYHQLGKDRQTGYRETSKEMARRKKRRVPVPDGDRTAMIRALAPNAVFILDESDNAAGDSDTNYRLMQILMGWGPQNERGDNDAARKPKGTYYSSATFAKRADNMPIYAVTDLGKAIPDPLRLATIFDSGGVGIQQVVSGMLARSGQYIRREMDYTGVTFTDHYIGEGPSAANPNPEQYRQADAFTDPLRDIVEFSGNVQMIIGQLNEELLADGEMIDGEMVADQLASVEFSSLIHNMVNQYILGVKAKAVGEEAVKQLAAGRKPVITVENTLEGPYNETVALGYDPNFQGLLRRYLYNALDVTRKKTDGTKVKQHINLDEHLNSLNPRIRALAEMLKDQHDTVQAKILASPVADLHISPLDTIREIIEEAGYTVGEITGRGVGIRRDGTKYKRSAADRNAAGKNRTLAKFNNSGKDGVRGYDALILNRSGAVGISAHNSPKFHDRRPRWMLVAQPNADIAIMMQMYGRIFRKGQLTLPQYILLLSQIAAERRIAGYLARKMKGLKANTTSNAKGVENTEAADLFNNYGDIATYTMLSRHPEIVAMLQNSLGGVLPDRFDDDGNDQMRRNGTWYKATSGEIAILPARYQDVFHNEAVDEWRAIIEQEDAMGTNELKVERLDLRADTTSWEVLAAGVGDSEFEGEARLETVTTQAGRAPMPFAEAKALMEANREAVEKKIEEWKDAYDAATVARMTDLDEKNAHRENWARQTRGEVLGRMRADQDLMRSAFAMLGRGMTMQIDGYTITGVVTDIKIDLDNPTTPSRHSVVMHVNSSKRTVSLRATEVRRKTVDISMDDAAERYDATISRSAQRHIVTGNLLAGWDALSRQGAKGKIVTYTTADGKINNGILLPLNYNPGETMVKIKDAQALINTLNRSIKVTTPSGLELKMTGQAGNYEVRVPAARNRGGRYWREAGFTRLLAGEMRQMGNEMVGAVRATNIPALFDFITNITKETLSYQQPRATGGTTFSAAAPEREARTEDRLSNYSDERLAKQIPTKPVQREWMNRGVFPSTLVHQPTPREQFAFKRKLESLKKARATHSDSASSIAADMHDMVNEMVPEGVPFFRIHGDIFDVDGLGISGKASQIKTFPEIAETFSAAAPERITPEQDREYLAAVKRGDMETAQRMVDAAAKVAGYKVGPLWHGGAKVTSYQTPLFLSPYEKVSESYRRNRAFDGAETATQRMFAKAKNPAGDADVLAVAKRLRLEGSIGEDSPPHEFLSPSIIGEDKVKAVISELKKQGFDSAHTDGDYSMDDSFSEYDSWTIFDPSQVKSADPITRDADGRVIPLSERFNPESDSILSAAAPERRAADAVAAGAKGREDTKEDRKAARAATMTTKPAGVASQIWDAIKTAGSATKRWWGEMPAYDSIDKAIGQWLGAGDTAPLKGTDIVIPGRQKAAHEARKLVETIVKQFPNVLTRQAISRYMEADGDKTTLQKWADQSKPETKAVYERALNLNAAEKAMAATATTFFKEKGEEAQKLGLLGNLLENYVTHFVEKAPANQRSGLMARILGDLASDTPASKLKTKFDHAIKRVFASMFDLEREGHSLRGGGDIAGTLGAYAQAANNTVADRVFVKSLTDIMARDGRPMAVPSGAITRTDGSADSPLLIKPHTHPADTSDYRPIAHPALRKWKWIGKEGEKDVLVEGELLIHPDLYKRLKNTLGTSALNNVPIIKAVGEFQGIVKQFMLSFSPFHFVQEGTHAIGHGNFKPWQVHEIDMEDPATRELVNAGLMLANWNAKAEFGEGLTASGMEKFLSRFGLGKLGKLNDTMSAFLFEKYIPGLKIAMGKAAMVRNMKRFKKELASGKMTREQVAQKTAQQANDAFGEQNNLYAGNNPTRLHFERLLFLAPDFLKSRAKFFADAFRKHGKEQFKALILLAVVLAVTAKLIERMLTGKNDWEKPFSVVTEGREYELRSVPGDVIALLKNRRQFVMGRISPLISRTALEAATGRDWRGVQRSAGQQVKDLAMVPIPLALRGVIDPEAPNISTAESLISSSGLRTIRHSEITKARMLGREWQKANGSDHVDEVHPPSKYVGMKNALEDGDDGRAMKEYGKLLATMPKEKADTGFRSSLMKPFSGSLANEKAFAASLSGDDRATYQAAMTKRGRMLAAFTRMSATTRAPISAPKAKPSGGSSRALTAKEFFR